MHNVNYTVTERELHTHETVKRHELPVHQIVIMLELKLALRSAATLTQIWNHARQLAVVCSWIIAACHGLQW